MCLKLELNKSLIIPTVRPNSSAMSVIPCDFWTLRRVSSHLFTKIFSSLSSSAFFLRQLYVRLRQTFWLNTLYQLFQSDPLFLCFYFLRNRNFVGKGISTKISRLWIVRLCQSGTFGGNRFFCNLNSISCPVFRISFIEPTFSISKLFGFQHGGVFFSVAHQLRCKPVKSVEIVT